MQTRNYLKIALTLAIPTLLSTVAFASSGGHSGNGGVFFICPDRIKLVEVWEAEDLHHPLSLGRRDAPVAELMRTYLQRLRYFEDGRADDYAATAAIFLSDLELLAKNPNSDQTKLIRFTDGELNSSLDSDEINSPPGCTKVQGVTQNPPSIAGERLLTIYRPLWERLDNEMKALTLAHEINVSHAVAMGFVTTTRPARLLNQFIASPAIASSNSVCDYMRFMTEMGMVVQPKFTPDFGEFKYGGYYVHYDNGRTRCYPDTGRLQYSPGSRLYTFDRLITPAGQIHLKIVLAYPRFARSSTKLISADFDYEALDSPLSPPKLHQRDNGIPITIDTPYVLDEGRLMRGEPAGSYRIQLGAGTASFGADGSLAIKDMVRNERLPAIQQILTGKLLRTIGHADLRISADQRLSETLHP